MEGRSAGSNEKTGRGAKLKLLFAGLIRAALPALVFGLLAAMIVGPAPKGTDISNIMIAVYGARIEHVEDVGLLAALFIFAPPLLQLVLLGDTIPRAVEEDVYTLARTNNRMGWMIKKLIKVIVLSLLMSFLMLLSIYLYSRVRGSGSAELVPRAVLELMATWGLCQCAFTVLSNVIGLYIKPLYMIFITLFSYALGIVLMLTRHPAANFFPTVQGMLYAHRSIFGRLEEGFFTPVFSAGYLSAVILALSAFGAVRIRKKDLL